MRLPRPEELSAARTHKLRGDVEAAIVAERGKPDGRKLTKGAVNYGPGKPAEHCGDVPGWPVGCIHYQGNNACEIVKGFIGDRGWCNRWAKRSK